MLKERFWNCEALGLGGLKIDYKFELARKLYGQIAWLGAPQNAINIRSCLPTEFGRIDSIRN